MIQAAEAAVDPVLPRDVGKFPLDVVPALPGLVP
jgi:hypothetical protein